MNLTWLGASSVLLVLALAMFIAVPRLLRTRPTLSAIYAEKSALDILADESDEYSTTDYAPASVAAQETAPAASSYSVPSSADETREGFTVKKSRVAIFGIAVLSLALSLIFALLALISQLSWVLPAAFLLVSAGSLATLRVLAIRDAKQRGQIRRQQSHESPLVLTKLEDVSDQTVQKEPAEYETAKQAPVKTKVKPLAERPVELSVAPAPAPQKQAGQNPVNFAAKSLRYARTHRVEQRPVLEGTAGSEELTLRGETGEQFVPQTKNWEPTEVPQPTYLDLEEVQRELPAPIETDHYEKSRSKSLAEAQRLGEESAGFQLDDILARRRA